MDQAVPTTLYRFFDAAGVLLYVGIMVAPARWTAHESREWWPQVARITMERYPVRFLAAAAEAAAIRAEKPLYNIVHSTTRKPARPRVYRSHGQGSLAPRRDGRWQVSIQIKGRRRYWTVRDEIGGQLLLAAVQGRDASSDAKAKAIALLREDLG